VPKDYRGSLQAVPKCELTLGPASTTPNIQNIMVLIDWLRRRAPRSSGLILFILLVLAARFSYARRVWIEGGPTFADADCFTRMFRVRQLWEHSAFIQAYHSWENTPDGIVPHTTALLDWLIALVALPLRLLTPLAIDWAGWITPPLIAAVGAWMLWHLLQRLELGWTRWPILFTYALHPLLAWSNAVGRPDHQALLVPLLALLAVLECLRLRENRFDLIAGLAWGVALWVSLYEPLILLIGFLAGHAWARWFSTTSRPVLRWRPWAAALVLTTLGTWVLEGMRWPQPPLGHTPELRHWLAMIGELQPPPAAYALPFGLAWPIALAILLRSVRRLPDTALLLLPPVLLTLTLGLNQQRWLAFLPLPLSLLLLPALASVRSPTWKVILSCLHLVPMLGWLVWETSQLRPPNDLADLRRMATSIQGEGAILAPWWQSPALLYYSHRPIVASSSHQSLPGIIDSARFFSTSDFTQADNILRRRGVRWVAVEDPVRSFTNSRQILSGPNADLTIEPREVHRIVSLRLWDFKSVPTRYRLVYASPSWRLYHYTPEP
jgi:hypothetical protein